MVRVFFNQTTIAVAILRVSCLLIFMFLIASCSGNSQKKAMGNEHADSAELNNADTASSPKPEFSYGLPVDSYDLKKGKVAQNDYLADILKQFDVSYEKIDRLVEAAEGVFDVTDIRSGHFYCAFNNRDTASASSGCDYLVYEIDPVNYVVFQFKDTVAVYKEKKEVSVKKRKTAGVIDRSLWYTLQEQNASPVLAVRLSEIYAWSVDFYRIKEGDRFKVIYEQKYVDDEYIGVGDIKAAYFKHQGEEYYGFPFIQDEDREFYNEEGESLRKELLLAPLKFSRITSGYSKKRYHPVLKEYRSHLGTDYAASRGTPIRSVGDGSVIAARYGKHNGRFVKIRHNSVYTTQYLHMSKIASGIEKGASVKQGDIIGYVGATGLATGPHLCYRFWKNGKQVDPYKQDIPKADPVKESNMQAFENKYKPLKDSLDAMEFKQAEKPS